MRSCPYRLFVLVGLLFVGLGSRPASSQGIDSIETPAPRVAPATDTGRTDVDADVPFVRSPRKTVVRMLKLANVTSDDVVYDLGSGDGRIPIMAARTFGARGVGIEIRPKLVRRARHRAKESGVADRVEFRQGDLFDADFSDATVVTLYLLPDVNTRLRPMLFEQLDPGTRVVSHGFDMDEWEPEKVVKTGETYLYLWKIPHEIPEHLK